MIINYTVWPLTFSECSCLVFNILLLGISCVIVWGNIVNTHKNKFKKKWNHWRLTRTIMCAKFLCFTARCFLDNHEESQTIIILVYNLLTLFRILFRNVLYLSAVLKSNIVKTKCKSDIELTFRSKMLVQLKQKN